jgi:hypothetical protein
LEHDGGADHARAEIGAQPIRGDVGVEFAVGGGDDC